MFTVQSLHDYPSLVKAFMGLPADVFWHLIETLQAHQPDDEQRRLERDDRQRAVGGGRDFDQPLVIRVSLVLTYLRLHVPQAVVAALFGATQSDVSRELRRLLPALRAALPCPAGWQVDTTDEPVAEAERLTADRLADGRVLVDATEQRVSRPGDNDTRRRYYSGKKKAFTLKTQFVTDGEHHIVAISEAVPGAEHDKKLSDEVQTLAHLPDGCEVNADKGYQGLAAQVTLVSVRDAETGDVQSVPRLTVQTPVKKPKGQPLTEEQQMFNRALNAVRVRVEHCIGWVKNWALIATRFRCAHTIYTAVMHTVCGLVNAQTRRWQAAKSANCA